MQAPDRIPELFQKAANELELYKTMAELALEDMEAETALQASGASRQSTAPTVIQKAAEARLGFEAVRAAAGSPTDGQLKAMFDAVDTSGSGFIEIDELKAALAKNGKQADDESCRAILAECDMNADDKISFEEAKPLPTEPETAPPSVVSLSLLLPHTISCSLQLETFTCL